MLKSKAWYTLTPALLSLVACGQQPLSAVQPTSTAHASSPTASVAQPHPTGAASRNLLLPPTPSMAPLQRILELTNAARAEGRTCGTQVYPAAPPLAYHALLEHSAQAHAGDMATHNYFSHNSQDGRTFSQRISAAGYPWRTVGENIAAGYATPEMVVDSWLKSPSHCANIMNPAFKEIGIGYTYSAVSNYKHYWAQDFGSR